MRLISVLLILTSCSIFSDIVYSQPCAAAGINNGGGNDEYISNFQLNTINQSSTDQFPNPNYNDFTSISTDLIQGNSYSFSITNPLTYSTDQARMWVDWNQNDDFSDPGESVWLQTTTYTGGSSINYTYTGTLTVPMTATLGATTLRIRLRWGSATLTPCGDINYGDVEDYTVNIIAPPSGGSSNLIYWLRADAGTTTVGANLLSDWADQTTNNFDATSPSTNMPELMAPSQLFNFNNSVEFNKNTMGSLNVEHMTIAYDPLQNPDEMSLFVVGYQSQASNSYAPFITNTHTYYWHEGYYLGRHHGGAHVVFWIGNWDGGNVNDHPEQTLPTASHPYLYAGLRDASNNYVTYNNRSLTSKPHHSLETWASTEQLIIGACPEYNYTLVPVPTWPSTYPTLATGSALDGHIAEIMFYEGMLTASKRLMVSSYLAIKYGLTLGSDNSTPATMDYVASDETTVIWDQAANNGYNYDIAGIGLDNDNSLDQPKSHSTNQPVTLGVYNDILTIANGTNFASPSSISTDLSYLVWGHDNDPTHNTNVTVNYPTDNGEIIQTIFQREWKSQETGTVNTVTLEFDLSNVIGPGGLAGTNDLQYCRLLVDEDGDYSDGGATSIAPTSYNNATGIVYFEHDFQPPSGPETTQNKGFFFTLGSTNVNLSPLAVTFDNFDFDCHSGYTTYSWQTQNEHESSHFELYLAHEDMNFEHVATVEAQGESNSTVDYHVDINYSRAVYAMVLEYNQNGEVTEYGPYSVNCGLDQLIIYPNPADETLFIHYPGTDEFEIRIYDAMGKLVINEKNTHQLDLGEFSSGVYLLEIESNEIGTYNERIIKN